MAQLPSDVIHTLVQDAQVTLFTANEAGIDEFTIVGITITKNTTSDVNVDVFIDDSDIGAPYFIVKNRTIDDDGFSVPAKAIPLNANDLVIARPTTGSGEFVITMTVAKHGL